MRKVTRGHRITTQAKDESPLKLVIVAGARPNFMKVAPLIWAIRAHNKGHMDGPKIRYRLVHTGQHYDTNMSAIFFKELGIPPPHINLDVGSDTHAKQTSRIMAEFEPVCLREQPDWVVVVGDVNSTLACTLVASKILIPVAHIEAGLRSFDRTMPEEINRVVTDALADILFTPSPEASENLMHEGVPAAKVHLVGNIMIDTLVASLNRAEHSKLQFRHKLQKKQFVYVTLHRPANVDDPESLNRIMHVLSDLACRVPVVFPVHPRTQKILGQSDVFIDSSSNIALLEPVGYYDSLWLCQNALFVLTDSGGLQEESTYFRTPCLTLRPNTERPVTLTVGTNKLTCQESLALDIDAVLNGRHRIGGIPEFWDGHTADRILKHLVRASASEA